MDEKNTSELAEKLLDYPESEWNRIVSKWCKNDEEKQQKVIRNAHVNRNARNFVEDFQRRIYTLTKSSLIYGDSDPEQIAGYKVLKKLGSGSSSSVYLVENEEGEKAALKLLKGIPDDSYSRQRFESEQHILASLNHPNIARFAEGGISESGVPYVVVEFVDGLPIDEWCDRNKLSINDRIRLFQTVCRAVHYAHQNLVVHRDIKPDHVLVTNNGNIKLIDFGIAKLLESPLPGVVELRTRTGMRFMTPEYASPEQVRGEPVTTASDIYSLGVLLYQIITGRRPYTFKTTSMLEIERVVCDQEPPKPSDTVSKRLLRGSTSLSEVENYNPTEAAHLRQLDHSRFRKLLSGDLDLIVLMAMRKETSQRYSSALSLADDLENFLRGDPVMARPPTLRYRARKFLYRHKWAISVAAIALLILMGGLIGTLWQNQQVQLHAQRAESQAQIAEQVTDFLVNLFESGDPTVTRGNEITIEELLERGVEQALDPSHETSIQLNLLSALGRVYHNMGVHDKSAELYKTALEKAEHQNPPDPLLISNLQTGAGLNMRLMGNLAQADSLYKLALDNRRTVLGENDPLTIQSLDEWAGIHAYLTRDSDLADSLFQDVVDRRKAMLDPFDKDLAESLNNLAYIKMTKRDYHKALQLYEEADEIYRIALGDNHPERLRTLSSLAVAYHRTGNIGRSEQMYNSLIEKREKVLGKNHPQVAVSYYHLSELLKDTGRFEQAVSSIEKAELIMQNLDAPHQFHPDILLSKAMLYAQTGQTELAAETYRKTGRKCSEIRGEDSPGCLKIYQTMGEFFLGHQAVDEARIYLQLAFDGYSKRLDPESEQLKSLTLMLGAAQ